MITDAERHKLLVEWNGTTTDYLKDKCIHHLFAEQVERTADAIAVVFENQQLTYRQLNERANQLAHHLQRLGVGSETLVGVCMERSLEMIVSFWAILKAGGVYLPLDPSYPAERLAFMLEDAAPALILSKTQHRVLFPQKMPLVNLDAVATVVNAQPATNPATNSTAESLAYIIYTSGSTGQPKGVLVEHGGIGNLALAQSEQFAVRVDSRFLQFVSPNFDVSVGEIVTCLCAGATLVLAPPDLLLTSEQLPQLINHYAITHIEAPPVLLAMLNPDLLPTVQSVITGGETFSVDLARRWSTKSRFINAYGPTETTVTATLLNCTAYPITTQSPPIGKPLANKQIYILDAALQPLPVGIPGELYIGGVGVARGYLNRPELTAERFIANPFATGRLYCTGDLARWLPDGNIEFLGRIDQQVKLRGFRIELGEIEAVLRQHPAVQEAVVIAREDVAGEKRLVAYVVADKERGRQGDREIRQDDFPPSPSLSLSVSDFFVSDLRSHLQQKLPEYMVPSAFVLLEGLPLTPNGKVDRNALPAPAAVPLQRDDEDSIPRTPTEITLATIWQEVLRIKQVGRHTNFFALGGDSIISMKVVARVRQAGLQMTTRDLFQYQTIAQLAPIINPVTTAQPDQMVTPGDVPLTPIQQWFFNQNQPEPQHFNQAMLLETTPLVNPDWLTQALQQLIRHHDALRLRFTQAGESWRQFHTDEQETVALTIIDLAFAAMEERQRQLASKAEWAHSNFDLTTGPLLRAVLFDYGADEPGRLLLVIHHLVVDGVSWRILLEDLQTAYQQLSQGALIELPAKTTSFQAWAHWLVQVGQQAVAQELAYWQQTLTYPPLVLPMERTVAGESAVLEDTLASAGDVVCRFSATETHALLYDVPPVYQTQINDLLLTALLQSVNRWSGQRFLQLDLEGHGREDSIGSTVLPRTANPPDLSRTVGWFTSFFPVSLEQDQTEPGALLQSVKQQLSRIPNRGVGYSILRYLRQEPSLMARQAPPISFNYLGQFQDWGESASGDLLLRYAPESSGAAQSVHYRRPYLIAINGQVVHGKLEMVWTYNRHYHRQTAIEQLAENFRAALTALIEHCLLQTANDPDRERIVAKASGKQAATAEFTGAATNNRNERKTNKQAVALQPILRDRDFPLTFVQEEWWLRSQPSSSTDLPPWQNNTTPFHLRGKLSVGALSQSLNFLLQRHEILRTVYPVSNGSPVQRLLNHAEINLVYVDLSRLSELMQEREIEQMIRAEETLAFDLAHDLPLRTTLLHLNDEAHILLCTQYHISADNWSGGIFLDELVACYKAFTTDQPPRLPPLAIQYADFAVWQRQFFSPTVLAERQQYWRQFFATPPLPMLLPTDHPRPPMEKPKAHAAAEEQFTVSAAMTNKLKQLSQQQGATLPMVVLAAYTTLLYRYSTCADILIGTPISQRNHTWLEPLIGCFASMSLLRINLQGAPSFVAMLERVKQVQLTAFDCQDINLRQFARITSPDWLPQRLPAFQAVFNFVPTSAQANQLPDLTITTIGKPRLNIVADVALTLEQTQKNGTNPQLECYWNYRKDLFERTTIERMVQDFQILLENIVQEPMRTIDELPLTNLAAVG